MSKTLLILDIYAKNCITIFLKNEYNLRENIKLKWHSKRNIDHDINHFVQSVGAIGIFT